MTVSGPLTIGMLGGMSWESSAEYYRLANELVRDRLGGLHSARLLMASVDFADIEALQAAGDWDEAGRLLAGMARAVPGRDPGGVPAGLPRRNRPAVRGRCRGHRARLYRNRTARRGT